MIPLTIIVDGDVRVAFCMCARTASDVRSVECGRATVLRRAVCLSVSNSHAMPACHFSVALACWTACFCSFISRRGCFLPFALGFSLPFALVQVIDFHVVIMNLMSSRVLLFPSKVLINESTPDTGVRGRGTKIEVSVISSEY